MSEELIYNNNLDALDYIAETAGFSSLKLAMMEAIASIEDIKQINIHRVTYAKINKYSHEVIIPRNTINLISTIRKLIKEVTIEEKPYGLDKEDFLKAFATSHIVTNRADNTTKVVGVEILLNSGTILRKKLTGSSVIYEDNFLSSTSRWDILYN